MRLDPITSEEYQKYTEYLDGSRYISDTDYYDWKPRLCRLAVKLVAGIRNHRDQKGDDKCWMDDEELYKLLPEGYTPPERDTTVELSLCEQYIKCRRNPATTYVSPQRRIEELEEENKQLKKDIDYLIGRVNDKIEFSG